MSSRNEDLARDDVHVVDENHARRPGPPEHRAVRGPPPRSINHQRIVVANVHVLRIDRLHGDRRALLIDLLLAVAAQVPGGLRALPQGLHRGHGLRLLAEEGVAQVGGPLRALAHPREHVGIRDQRLHARLPRLVLHHLHRVVAAHARVAARPVRGLRYLVGVDRGSEDLREERIGIKRDRREQRVELGLRVQPLLRVRGRKRKQQAEGEEEGAHSPINAQA